MTVHESLSDGALAAMLTRRASRAQPQGLHAAIMSAVATTGQQRRSWLVRPGWLVAPPPERRLLSLIAIAGLLLAIATATAIVGSRLLEHSPRFPLGPSELVPSGIETLSPDPGRYELAVADRKGIIWAIGPGFLARYDPAAGIGRSWSIGDDARFDARSIVAARDGGVWLIGDRTLDRFDGTAFREALELDASVEAATESPDGSLWVATADGAVFHLDGASRTRIDALRPAPDATISAIAVDAEGHLWLGWRQDPGRAWVSRSDGSVWRIFDGSDSAPLTGNVTAIAVPPDGSVWIGTEHGLARFDGAAWTDLTGREPALGSVDSVIAVENGEIWAAFQDPFSGSVTAARFDGQVRTVFAGAGIGWDVSLVAANGRVIAGSSNGLHVLNDDGWQPVWPTDSPAGPAPFDGGGPPRLIALSSEEGWVGDLSGEVWHYASGAWSRTPTLKSSVNDLVRTDDGTIWACTRFSGRYRLEGTTWTVATAGDGGCALATDATGTLWVVEPGSEGWAVVAYTFDGRTWTERTRSPSTDLIWGPGRLGITPDGAIWVGAEGKWGALGGLVRYIDGAWEEIRLPDTPADFIVRDLIVARDGEVWVAGQDVDPTEATTGPKSWVARFDGTRWTVYRPAAILTLSDPLARNWALIWDLAVGPDDTIWAATSDGLARFDGAAWTTRHPGIWFGAVSVAPDETVWVDSTHGVGRLTTSASSR